MKIFNIPHGSTEWSQARLGIPTASDFDNHNVFLHGTEGDFPYEGAALAVHLAACRREAPMAD